MKQPHKQFHPGLTEWEWELKCGLYRAIGQKRREYPDDAALIALLDALEGLVSCTTLPRVLDKQATRHIRPDENHSPDE